MSCLKVYTPAQTSEDNICFYLTLDLTLSRSVLRGFIGRIMEYFVLEETLQVH